MTRRRIVLLVIAAALLAAPPLASLFSPQGPGGLADFVETLFARPGSERAAGFYTLVDEQGRPLLRTAMNIRRGDLFIDAANGYHRVTRLRGDIAETVLETPDGAPIPGATAAATMPAATAVLPRTAASALGPQAIPLGTARRVIVIYHTHSDESFIPTDGTESIPAGGGVYDVGETMASSLTTAGFTVVHDLAAHDPHDAGAYPRSRRTVLRNLQYGPTVLFDVHRDAAPASECLTTIDGVETARILIVIGGANPFFRANLGVANQMKAIADRLYPGIMRGVLVSTFNNFNQDLDPADILLEMGTHTIPKPAAQRAAQLWANVVSGYLGPPGPERPTAGQGVPDSADSSPSH